MTIMTSRVVETNDSENDQSSALSDSDSEAGSDSSKGNEESGTSKSNAGWADSIAKILKTNKPKKKKTLVLSKAKKLTDVKREKPVPASFEVATTDGEIKEEKIEVKEEIVNRSDEPPRKKKRDLPKLRVKPNILEKDREKTLSKIATKGVVQLFNAVRMQQNDIGKKLREAGPLEVRKEKVMKNIDKTAFLDVLMEGKSEIVDQPTTTIKSDSGSSQATWNVLRDDFMVGAKLKDWDKELEEVEDEGELE